MLLRIKIKAHIVVLLPTITLVISKRWIAERYASIYQDYLKILHSIMQKNKAFTREHGIY
jgi:hypothetical protein